MTTNTLHVHTRDEVTTRLDAAKQACAQHQDPIRRNPVHYHVGRCRYGSRFRGFVALLVMFAGACSMIGTTSSARAATLPDGRGYELVSPPDAQGVSSWSAFDPTSENLLQGWGAVAADGSAVLWRATTALPGAPDSSGLFDTYRSVRGLSSWESRYAGTPSLTSGVKPSDLVFASPNVDRLLWMTYNATIDPSDHDPISPVLDPANINRYMDLYRTSADGSIAHVNRGSIEVPAPGEEPAFYGASDDLGRVLFTTNRQLVPEAPSGNITSTYWTDGHTTKLVSKDAADTPLVNNVTSGLSEDGSTAVVLHGDGIDPSTIDETLYVWSAESGATEKAFGPVLAPGSIRGDVTVDSISTDGKRIFLTTAVSLAADDTDLSNDLYEYDTSSRQITLLSAPRGGGVLGNSDACAVPLTGLGRCDVSPVIESRDGSTVYFVSPEQIVSGQGVDGGANLYQASGGQIRFVVTLAPDDPVFRGTRFLGRAIGDIRSRHVRLTPDGSKLLFESRAALTSYDNGGFMEIYLYDPASREIMCASCRANGTPPTADSSLFIFGGGAADAIGGRWPMSSANADEHGDRLFFNSGDAVVPQDVNGRSDVYEFTVASRTPVLISSGRGERDSAYVGNGVSGRDVFFLTADSLVPEDRNGEIYKMYNARIGAFPPPPEPPSECQGAACRGDEAAPPLGAQGSGRVVPRARSAPKKPKVAVSRLAVSGSRSVKGKSLRLTAKVSGAGHLKVTGRGLRSVSRQTSRAASYHLTVRLSKASAAKLRRLGRVVVSATVRFVPREGSARSVAVRLTFAGPSTRNAR